MIMKTTSSDPNEIYIPCPWHLTGGIEYTKSVTDKRPFNVLMLKQAVRQRKGELPIARVERGVTGFYKQATFRVEAR